MAGKQRVFDISTADKQFLQRYVSQGEGKARSLRRARSLLLLHQGKTTTEVASLMEVNYNTVSRTKKVYQAEGLQAALQEGKRSGRPPRIDGGQRAKITALACSEPPPGYSQWSVRLLADKYDACYPVICMDERPCFLIGDTIAPLDMKPGSVKKQDYTYEKLGSATLFMAVEPLSGQRYAKVYDRRRKREYADFIHYVASHYPKPNSYG